MIKVPFDTDGNHGNSQRAEYMTTHDLKQTLDNAYKTMDWFKYLADRAISVKVLEQYYDAQKHLTTHIVGFKLEPKHETYYLLKYHG